jgi:hypothetical protein
MSKTACDVEAADSQVPEFSARDAGPETASTDPRERGGPTMGVGSLPPIHQLGSHLVAT